jgi:hypothetical protein
MSVSCECCVLSGKRSLRWADHSSRGVLLSVAYLSVIGSVLRRPWTTRDCCASGGGGGEV